MPRDANQAVQDRIWAICRSFVLIVCLQAVDELRRLDAAKTVMADRAAWHVCAILATTAGGGWLARLQHTAKVSSFESYYGKKVGRKADLQTDETPIVPIYVRVSRARKWSRCLELRSIPRIGLTTFLAPFLGPCSIGSSKLPIWLTPSGCPLTISSERMSNGPRLPPTPGDVRGTPDATSPSVIQQRRRAP
jgi:hypothetical protein